MRMELFLIMFLCGVPFREFSARSEKYIVVTRSVLKDNASFGDERKSEHTATGLISTAVKMAESRKAYKSDRSNIEETTNFFYIVCGTHSSLVFLTLLCGLFRNYFGEETCLTTEDSSTAASLPIYRSTFVESR